MTRKTHNLVIPEGQYTDKNGQTKTNWTTIGAMFEGDNGRRFITIKRTFAPSGVPFDDKGSNRDSIIINLFDANSRGY
ncbi:MAG: hypothetical protein IJL18_01445 [Synergistaceae bacterium]|nr:hypothetical protein [Synergistaceae bacterium]